MYRWQTIRTTEQSGPELAHSLSVSPFSPPTQHHHYHPSCTGVYRLIVGAGRQEQLGGKQWKRLLAGAPLPPRPAAASLASASHRGTATPKTSKAQPNLHSNPLAMLLAVVFVQALAALALVSGSPLHGLVRDPASGFVVTPAGLVHPSCVTRSRSGDHIIDLPSENRDFFIVQSADGNTRRVLRCTAANAWRPLRSAANGEADGWQAFTSFNNVGNKTFDAFLGTMSVPKTPSSGFGFSSRVLFYFTGLQSDNWVPENAGPFDNVPPGFDIIQPVVCFFSSSLFWRLLLPLPANCKLGRRRDFAD